MPVRRWIEETNVPLIVRKAAWGFGLDDGMVILALRLNNGAPDECFAIGPLAAVVEILRSQLARLEGQLVSLTDAAPSAGVDPLG